MHFRGLSRLLLIVIAVLAFRAHAESVPGSVADNQTPTYKEVMCNTLSTMTLSVAEAKEKEVPKEKTQAAVSLSIERFKTDMLATNPQTREWLEEVTPLISDIMKDSTEKIYATIGLSPQQWAEDMLSACVQGMTYLPAAASPKQEQHTPD